LWNMVCDFINRRWCLDMGIKLWYYCIFFLPGLADPNRPGRTLHLLKAQTQKILAGKEKQGIANPNPYLFVY
jgi:hypothetical protein